MRTRWLLVVLMAMGLVSVMAPALRAADAKEAEKEKKTKVKVTLDQLPAAVKDTIQTEAKAGTLGDIEKVTKDAKTYYEADIVIEGKKWEVKVGEDGKVISKAVDEEKDDAKDDDDKDEKKGDDKDDD